MVYINFDPTARFSDKSPSSGKGKYKEIHNISTLLSTKIHRPEIF